MWLTPSAKRLAHYIELFREDAQDEGEAVKEKCREARRLNSFSEKEFAFNALAPRHRAPKAQDALHFNPGTFNVISGFAN